MGESKDIFEEIAELWAKDFGSEKDAPAPNPKDAPASNPEHAPASNPEHAPASNPEHAPAPKATPKKNDPNIPKPYTHSEQMNDYYEIAKKLREIMTSTQEGTKGMQKSKARQVKKALSSLRNLMSITIAQETMAQLDMTVLEENLPGEKLGQKYISKLSKKYPENRRVKLTNKQFEKLRTADVKSEKRITSFTGKKIMMETSTPGAYPFPEAAAESLALFSAEGRIPGRKVKTTLTDDAVEQRKKVVAVANRMSAIAEGIGRLKNKKPSEAAKCDTALEYFDKLYKDICQLAKNYATIDALGKNLLQINQTLESNTMDKGTTGYRYLENVRKKHEQHATKLQEETRELLETIINLPTFKAIESAGKSTNEETCQTIVDITALQRLVEVHSRDYNNGEYSGEFPEYVEERMPGQLTPEMQGYAQYLGRKGR